MTDHTYKKSERSNPNNSRITGTNKNQEFNKIKYNPIIDDKINEHLKQAASFPLLNFDIKYQIRKLNKKQITSIQSKLNKLSPEQFYKAIEIIESKQYQIESYISSNEFSDSLNGYYINNEGKIRCCIYQLIVIEEDQFKERLSQYKEKKSYKLADDDNVDVQFQESFYFKEFLIGIVIYQLRDLLYENIFFQLKYAYQNIDEFKNFEQDFDRVFEAVQERKIKNSNKINYGSLNEYLTYLMSNYELSVSQQIILKLTNCCQSEVYSIDFIELLENAKFLYMDYQNYKYDNLCQINNSLLKYKVGIIIRIQTFRKILEDQNINLNQCQQIQKLIIQYKQQELQQNIKDRIQIILQNQQNKEIKIKKYKKLIMGKLKKLNSRYQKAQQQINYFRLYKHKVDKELDKLENFKYVKNQNEIIQINPQDKLNYFGISKKQLYKIKDLLTGINIHLLSMIEINPDYIILRGLRVENQFDSFCLLKLQKSKIQFREIDRSRKIFSTYLQKIGMQCHIQSLQQQILIIRKTLILTQRQCNIITNDNKDLPDSSNITYQESSQKVQEQFEKKIDKQTDQTIKTNLNYISLEEFKLVQNKLEEYQYYMQSYLFKGGEADILYGYKHIDDIEIEEYVFRICKADEKSFLKIKEENEMIEQLEFSKIINYEESLYLEEQHIGIFIMKQCQYSLRDEVNQLKQTNNNYSEFQICKIFCDLLWGMVHIQKCNIIHQDIKPTNILKSYSGEYLISDFGCASYLINNQAKITGYTKNYCAPEVLDEENDVIDSKADIYSLGKTFEFLLNFYIKHYEKLHNNQTCLFGNSLLNFVQQSMSQFDKNQRLQYEQIIKGFFHIIVQFNSIKFLNYYFEIRTDLDKLSRNKERGYSQFIITKKIIKIIILFYTRLCPKSEDNRYTRSFHQYFEDEIYEFYDRTLEIFLDIIKQYLIQGNIHEAQTYLTQLINLSELSKKNSYLFYLDTFGKFYAEQNEYEKAVFYILNSIKSKRQLKFDFEDISDSLFYAGQCFFNIQDYQKSLLYLEEFLNNSNKNIKNNIYLRNCQVFIGNCYYNIGNIEKALDHLLISYEIHKNVCEQNSSFKNDLIFILHKICRCYLDIGNINSAHQFLLEVKKILNQSFDNQINNQLAMGDYYTQNADFQSALDNYLESHKIFKKMYKQILPTKYAILHKIANGYLNIRDLNNALKYFLDLEQDYNNHKENHEDTAYLLFKISCIYYQLDQYEQALKYGLRSLELNKQQLNQNKKLIFLTQKSIGDCYLMLNNIQLALDNYLEVLILEEFILKEQKSQNVKSIMPDYNVKFVDQHFQYSLKIVKELNYDTSNILSDLYLNIVKCFDQIKNPQLELKHLLKSLEINQKYYNQNQKNNLFLLKRVSNIYNELQDKEKYEEFHQKYLNQQNNITIEKLINESNQKNDVIEKD